MLIQFQDYLTFENIFLWINFAVLPFWIMLVGIPNSKITQLLVNSIFLPLVFASTYVFIIYQAILLDENLLDVFKLYLSLDNLYTVFATESFLVVFWIHFIAINLFLGSWMSRDGIKYSIPKILMSFSLILVYFSGPLGIVFYWFIRIFYGKRIGLHD